MRANSGAEIVGRTGIQEHDFVAGFHPETEPSGIEFNAAAGIEHAAGVAVNNVIDLIVDHAGGHRSAHAKVHKAAFQQSKNAYRSGGLDLQSKEPVEQPHIGANSAGNDADW